jgi:ubiquinone/menaquinone biosynthesis C-methylase UbiE
VMFLGVAFYALGIAAPFLDLASGSALLAAMHLQPAIALAGAPVRARDLALVTLLRAPLEIVSALRIGLAWRPGREPDEIAVRRATYAEVDPAQLFEPRRSDCPLCGGAALHRALATSDMVQAKPGRFHLDRCASCRHVFQNPRLSIAGLGYYYGDAYDGLQVDTAYHLFGLQRQVYVDRAAAVGSVTQPRRWLDIGGGHGHFCAVARERFPDARFEALDLSESIGEAERRGWIHRAHRGLFVEQVEALRSDTDPIDVVSMNHYLEHTLDPIAEIRAANQVLADGGVLHIEVPDPESRLGRLLGGLWFPWLQPQHLHFLSADNLDGLLRKNGFEPLLWHRGQAHIAGDLLFAALLLVRRIAPEPRAPWRRQPGIGAFVWHNVAFLAFTPLLVLARLLDIATAPLLRRPRWANTYRMVARKVARVA